MATSLQERLASIQIGDRITYTNGGHQETGEVCGWRTLLPDRGPYCLVFNPSGPIDKQIGLSVILERRRPGNGGGILQFD
jgi:hypothetical protein